jgi:predicted lipoprotein with Yx(FWY)xxD motif
MSRVGTRKSRPEETRPSASADPGRRLSIALRLGGSGLLAATASIHLDLYLTGFRNIPAIGWLFLLQLITGFGLAGVIAVSGSRLAAAAGAVFALSTLGGYLLAVWIGLFGFREVRTTAGIPAGVLEVTAFGVLATYSLAPGRRSAPAWPAAARIAARLEAVAPLAAKGAAAIAVVAAVLLVTGLATAGAPKAAASGGSLTAATVGGTRVLTDSRGRTLYQFAPDTAATSKCYGSCVAYWPVVQGPVTAGPGVSGKIAAIKRTDGTLQATYNGHPLYTYIGDSAPGQANGNNLNINGGLWLDVPISR